MIVRHVSSGGDAGYAVKRLVRGMCSSRESARQGFASCLAKVLSVLPEDEVSFDGIRVALSGVLHKRVVGVGGLLSAAFGWSLALRSCRTSGLLLLSKALLTTVI